MEFLYSRFYNWFYSWLDDVGRSVLRNIEYTLHLFFMVYLSIRATVKDQAQGLRTIFGVVSAQIYFTGWQAMPLISVLAMASGGVVILQSATQLNMLGGTSMMGQLLVILVVRELAPLMTSLVVIARSGTAVASEVGNMRANREIEALESMGINPLSYIVFPRLVGGLISVMCLSFYYVMISLLGGYILTKAIHNMSLSYYLDSLAKAVAFEDLWLFLLKTAFSGMIIFIVSCHQGLSVKRSPTEVPVVTTQAVVKSIIYVIVFNISVSALFYINQLVKMGVL